MFQYTNLFLMLCVAIVSSIEAKPTDDDQAMDQKHLLKRSSFSERDLANRLLSRLLDVAYETFRDLGVSSEELQQVQHKRSRISACYFQAVTCY